MRGFDMRNQFTQSILDEIDIIQLISEDVTIEGNKANCPFPDHNDANPSFTVYPPDGFYCFGCNKGGTAIDYVMYRDGVKVSEAIHILCEKYNIQRPDWTPEEKVKFEKRQSEKEVISKVLHDAFKIYHDEMDETHRGYFRGRGLTDETINTDLLGYAPDDDTFLFKRLREKYSEKDLLLSGLFVKVSGSIKDAYQRRYLFPYWHQRKIVYSIGRLDTDDPEEIENLPQWNRGKYKKHLTHSEKHPYVSETIENVIYNADCVKSFKKGIVTEGIVDALLTKQSGFGVLSPVTVKFKKRDIEALRELAQHWEIIHVINDNETNKRGEEGALDTAEELFQDGQDVRIVTLPLPDDVDKIDLADFLNVPVDQQDKRIDELRQLMDEAPDFIEWKINEATELDGKKKLKMTQEIFALLTSVDEKLKLEHYAELMQKHELINGKRLFWSALKDARIEKAKERKQKRMKSLEKESSELFLKAQIEEIRKDKYSKAFEIKRDVSHTVLDDMRESGRFYRTPTNQYYWFSEDLKRLCEIGDKFFEQLVNDRYGLNKTEAEYEYLCADLETEAGRRGKESEIYRFAHYDKHNHVLYIDRNDFQMYRLDGTNIDLIPNGTNGVLFITDPQNESFELKDIGEEEYLRPLIIDPTNFVEGAHVNLNPDEQKYLFQIWIATLFFEELQPTKTIQVFIGPQGSGKTTRQRIVGQWLFGRHFNVQGINDEDDFIATITHNYFAVCDNVDTYQKWLNDRLAQVATGQRIEKRELYTTNRLVRYYPRCFLSLNSREPKFKRPDVVDRLLLFRVQRLEKFSSEARLLAKIDKYRNELWSEMLIKLSQIITAIKADDEPFLSQHRMADWAELGWRIAKTQDASNYFIELLEKMDREQSEFVLEDNPVYQCLEGLLLEEDKLIDMSSAELYKLFKEYAEKDDIDFSFKSSRSLGMHLRNILPDLKEFFEITEDKKKNCWVYSFEFKEKNE
jgi:DNA primase